MCTNMFKIHTYVCAHTRTLTRACSYKHKRKEYCLEYEEAMIILVWTGMGNGCKLKRHQAINQPIKCLQLFETMQSDFPCLSVWCVFPFQR